MSEWISGHRRRVERQRVLCRVYNMDELMNSRIAACIDAWMDAWTNEGANGRTDGWMDGWMESPYICSSILDA